MRDILAVLQLRWREEGLGIDLGDGGKKRLTHLAWADNIYFFDHNIDNIRKMFSDFTEMLLDRDLDWKEGSIEFLTQEGKKRRREEDDLEVEQFVVRDKVYTACRRKEMEVLGVMIADNGNTDSSLAHRIAKATRATYAKQSDLVNKRIAEGMRFQIYHRDIMSVVLHGAAGWVWTKGLHDKLEAFENWVLRMIGAKARSEGEEYHEWVKRETDEVKERYWKAGFKSITTRVLFKIFDYARNSIIVQNTDTQAATIQKDIIKWKDNTWWNMMQPGDSQDRHTGRGRLKTKWETIFWQQWDTEWYDQVGNCPKHELQHFKVDFVRKVFQRNKIKYTKDIDRIAAPKISARLLQAKQDKKKRERKRKREELEQAKGRASEEVWQTGSKSQDVVQIRGDSQVVINWLNGAAIITGREEESRASTLQEVLHHLWITAKAIPWDYAGDWAKHVYREDNGRADALANQAMDGKKINRWHLWDRRLEGSQRFRMSFDGGYRRRTQKSGAGWLIELWENDRWQIIHEGNLVLDVSDSLQTELAALENGMRALVKILAPWVQDAFDLAVL